MSAPEIIALLDATGWSIDSEPQRIGNTGNNRAYRVTAFGRDALVKHYFQHPGDPRDRFAAERGFYEFLWQNGVRSIPEPIAWAPSLRLGLFEFIPGERPREATPELVTRAAAFFREINTLRHTAAAAALSAASEACFTLRAHLACVERRIARLAQVPAGPGVEGEAFTFIHERLVPSWRRIERRVVDKTPASALDLEIPGPHRCVSPSDFGFHNSLRTPDGGIRFFDFEYAGWDDPAKTVCDFFHQPAVPVASEHLEVLLAGFADFADPGLRARIDALFSVYAVKWCCIMLNEFLPAERERRAFSNPQENPATRQHAQLEKVRGYLAVFTHA